MGWGGIGGAPRRRPDLGEEMSLFERALVAGQVGDPQMAYALLVAATRDEPENAEAWWRLGMALAEIKKHEAAVGCLTRADVLRPRHAPTLVALGWALHLVGRDEEAHDGLRSAIEADPRLALAWTDLSAVRIGLEAGETVEMARRAVALEPAAPLHHVQRAMALFHVKQWVEGFREFEWRLAWKMPETLRYPYRLWRGEKAGTLFLQAEQGLGDSLMALRWIGLCEGRAERVILYVQPELRRFFVSRLPWAEIHALPRPMPPADAWCPFMSLPVALDLDDPVLEGGERSVWRRSRSVWVGIAWAGNPAHEAARLRDVPLAELLRLAEVPGVTLHSFQVGAAVNDVADLGCHALVEEMAPQISDMADTATLVEEMDLVVCCDTALGHLAGTLGKPCWLLVDQRAADWRWGTGGEDAAWYPRHRLWRRARGEGWGAVVGRMIEELRR